MTTLFGIFLAVSVIGNIVLAVTLREYTKREYVARMGYTRKWACNGDRWDYVKGKWEGHLDDAYRRAKREHEIATYGLTDKPSLIKTEQFGQWKENDADSR